MNRPLVPEDLDRPPFKRDPVLSIVRAAIASARARSERPFSAVEHAERAWPFDRDAHLVLRAATAPTDMTNAAALVQIATAVLAMLTPHSAATQLFERCLSVTFGSDGQIGVPAVGVMAVGFVAEGARKPVVQGVSTGARLDPRKIAGIAVASSELFSQLAAEAAIRQALGESIGPALDAIVFSNVAGDAAHPAGILNGIAGLTPTAGGGAKTDILLGDLQKLAAALGPVTGASPIVFAMNPVQAIALQHGVIQNVAPLVITSSSIAAGTVIAIAVNAIASAVGVPTFETSTQAMLTMDNAPPAWPTGPVSSVWQTASVAVKMLFDVSWAVRSPQGVAWMASVNW